MSQALRSLGRLLPSVLSASSHLQSQAGRGFRAVADVEINLSDRETLKKYVGVRDHLSKEHVTKAQFVQALQNILGEVKSLPDKSDYRRALEATANYRLKVCSTNSAPDVEEVLDSHMEELIVECHEEMKLIALMKETQPWDVPETRTVPVFDYVDAASVLSSPKK